MESRVSPADSVIFESNGPKITSFPNAQAVKLPVERAKIKRSLRKVRPSSASAIGGALSVAPKTTSGDIDYEVTYNMAHGSLIYNYLEHNQIPYEEIHHALALTTREAARVAGLREQDLVKAVVVQLDGLVSLAVLRGDEEIDRDRLMSIVGASSLRILREEEFFELFPDCERGAVPPLGDLYGLPVLLSQSVEAEPSITFNGGSHTTLLSIPLSVFKHRVNPTIGAFAQR